MTSAIACFTKHTCTSGAKLHNSTLCSLSSRTDVERVMCCDRRFPIAGSSQHFREWLGVRILEYTQRWLGLWKTGLRRRQLEQACDEMSACPSESINAPDFVYFKSLDGLFLSTQLCFVKLISRPLLDRNVDRLSFY